jgi:hypothetical protein
MNPRPEGTYADYGAVQALNDQELETLLRTGDGPERVWAAWSLGLRKGASAVPTLAAAADRAPDPGVRARLAVILAGYGEIETLSVFATDDPDADVRASACVQLARTSLPQLAWVQKLLQDRLRIDTAVPVQLVLLDLVLGGQLSIDAEQLRLALRHPDWRIRKRAADYVMTIWVHDDEMPGGVVDVLGDLDLDIRADIRDTALDRLGVEGFLRMLGGLEGIPTDIVRWHLDEVVRTRREAPWSAIAELTDRPGLEDELVVLVAGGDVASRAWLLDLVGTYAGYGWWQAREKLLLVLEAAPPLSIDERNVATEIRDRVEQQLAEPPPEEWMDAEDIEEQEEWLASLRDYRQALDRAIRSATE